MTNAKTNLIVENITTESIRSMNKESIRATSGSLLDKAQNSMISLSEILVELVSEFHLGDEKGNGINDGTKIAAFYTGLYNASMKQTHPREHNVFLKVLREYAPLKWTKEEGSKTALKKDDGGFLMVTTDKEALAKRFKDALNVEIDQVKGDDKVKARAELVSLLKEECKIREHECIFFSKLDTEDKPKKKELSEMDDKEKQEVKEKFLKTVAGSAKRAKTNGVTAEEHFKKLMFAYELTTADVIKMLSGEDAE